MRRFASFFFGALTGGVVGAVLALLFAPAAGKDTRERILTATQKFGQEVRSAAENKRQELEIQLKSLRSGGNPPAA